MGPGVLSFKKCAMFKNVLGFVLIVTFFSCNNNIGKNNAHNRSQDEWYVNRLKEGADKFIAGLKKMNYHRNINVDESIYSRIAKNFHPDGSLALYSMGTSGFDSENDGMYKGMFVDLQKAVKNKYKLENYQESDKFFNAEGELSGHYGPMEAWDVDIVNSASKQLKTISFELKGSIYEKEFQQYTDLVNYEVVIDELLNTALEKEGYKEKWIALPSIDQTYVVVFTTPDFFKNINDQGFIGTQKYYNALPY